MKYGRFRIAQWDYLLVCAQIVSMQFLIYFVLGVLITSISYSFGRKYSIADLFQYNAIQISDFDGKVIVCIFVLNTVFSALFLWYIVKRAKQCLDFSCTFHGFHFLICWWYNSSLPLSLSWWLLNMITSVLMCIGGEFLCLRSELNKIPVGYSALNEKSDV